MMVGLLNTWYRMCYTMWVVFYDRLVRPYDRLRQRSVALLDVQPGERVLIVGAGTGLDLKYIGPGAVITAIDLTPAMLGRLRRRARELGIEVDARVMDAHAMTFSADSFDMVVLHLILAVVPSPGRCMMEVARVLRPGGRVVVMDKFVTEDSRLLPLLWWLNLPLKLLGTNINRRLGPILVGTGLRITHQEPAGMRGLFKIILLTT